MTKTNYSARIRSLRRVLTGATALLIVLAVGLVVSVITRPHLTTLITVASVSGALVIVLLGLALRIAFRNLPEAERMASKFDGEAAADQNGKADARDGGEL